VRVELGRRTVVGNSGFLLVSRLVTSGISFVGTAIIARTLLPGQWGVYTFVISLTTVLDLLFDFQVSRLVLRELHDPDRDPGEVIGSFTILRVGLGAVSYLAALAFAALVLKPELFPAVAVGGLTLVLSSGWNAVNLFYTSRLWLRPAAVVMVGSRVVFVVLCIGFAKNGSTSVTDFLWASVINEAIPCLVFAVLVRRHMRLKPRLEPSRWWRWIKDAVPIAIGGAIGTLYFRIDALLVGKLSSFNALGFYAIGYKFSDLIGYLYVSISAAVLALLIRDWPGRIDLFKRTWRGAFVILTITGVGITAGFLVFARPAIVTLFGSRYADATAAARLVVGGQGLKFFGGLCVMTLVAVHRNREFVVATIVGLVVNVVVNLYVIPRWSYVGAAWVTLITELCVVAVLARATMRVPDVPRPPWWLVAKVAVAAAALIAVGLLAEQVIAWPFAALAAGATYLLMLHALGVDGEGGLRVVPHLLGETGPPAEPVIVGTYD
jgi:O-antigen/teichoic acid export membrane protein